MNYSGGTGAEVIYALRNTPTLASKILENIGKTGQSTRRYYQRRLPSDPSKDYYFMHRNTGDTESLIVEYGFIDDTSNNKFLNDNYKQLAEAVIEAITDYKGIPYISPFEDNNIYIVKKGDSLYSVANRYNTTVDILKRLNNLTSNTLSIGQILVLPTTNENIDDNNYTEYIIKRGDTLYSIANKYNTTVSELKILNNLINNDLSVGQSILVPLVDIIDEEIILPEEPEDANTNTYTVEKGDTLYSIANKYNITVDDLKRLNNLTNNNLSIGDILTIKELDTNPDTNNETYIVKSGDTIYSIANKYGISANDLKILNNLTSNLLRIGQELIVPSTNMEETDTYTVQNGDTLYSIARKYNTTVDNIKDLNNLNNNTLSIGQVLKIK